MQAADLAVLGLPPLHHTKAKERFFPTEDQGTPADVALLEEIRDLLQPNRTWIHRVTNAVPGASAPHRMAARRSAAI